MDKRPDHIIIFDGVCNFCNATVNFIMKYDKKSRFYFTANQSGEGQKILQDFGIETTDVGTIYLYTAGKIYHKSTAALRIASFLQFPFNLAYAFIIVPAFFRDAIYSFIAKNRYKWFGKKESCRIPSPEEAVRFI